MTTVRDWLLQNLPFYPDREELIALCRRETGVQRSQVVRILTSMREEMPTDAGPASESDLTPHLKYNSMYERFAEWMGIEGSREPTPLKMPGSEVIHGVLACLHAPFHDELALKEAFEWFKAEKVTELHLAGDLADLHSMSHFTKFENVPIQREAVEARKILDFFSRNFERVKVLEGNHEARERKYLARTLPPDLLAWFLEKSFLERLVEGMENVELVKMKVENAADYELGWIEVVGDAVIGHAERVTSMVDSLRGVEKLRMWLNSGWSEVLGIPPAKVVLNAHSHKAGVIPVGDAILCELGCCCKLSSYALSPTKLYSKPQTQAATIFRQVDGVTDINSIRQRYLGRER